MNLPRRALPAWRMEETSRRVYCVDTDLAIRKGFTFYQTRSNTIILQGTLPAYCIPKVVRLKTGEVLNEKAYMSPRPPPKISLRHDWTKELGSKVARLSQEAVARQPRDKQNSSNQPNQSQNQFVIDQGNLITNTKCLLIKAKHPGLKRSRRNIHTKNSVFQIDQGNLISCLA